jgi:hypothetical protein
MVRHPLARMLLALALLLGQAGAFAHAISHLHPRDPGLPEPVCELCVAHANLGSFVPPSVASLPVVAADVPVSPAVAVCAAEPRTERACARAPPIRA